jgi:anti-sigma B factor antagonist
MTIEIKKCEDQVVLELSGRIDAVSAPALDSKINENIDLAKNLVFDFKGIEYVSSAGLRVLLSAQKKMQEKGTMKLKNVCEEVMDVFEMTGFADILTIE